MEAESRYLATLAEVRAARTGDDRLELLDGEGDVLLTFGPGEGD